jgi:hypothetical protein
MNRRFLDIAHKILSIDTYFPERKLQRNIKSWVAINLFRSLAVTWRETPQRKTKLLVELTISIMQSRIQLSSTLLVVEGMAVDVEAVHATVSVAVGESWTGTDVATVWADWVI